MSKHWDDYEQDRKDTKTCERIIMAILIVIVAGLLFAFFSGCASVQEVNWTQVVQQLKYYYDSIPPEQIEQLKDALKQIK